MKGTNTVHRAAILIAVILLLGSAAVAGPKSANEKKIEFTTNSAEAKDCIAKIVNMVETMNVTPATNALARKAVDADPNFAFGYYLLGTTSATPEDAKKYSEQAVALAKSASEGERQYIQAVLVARSPKPADSIPMFNELASKFPRERMVQMMLGQVYLAANNLEESRMAFERAIRLDNSTPRAYSFLGNIELLKGDYAKARHLFNISLGKQAPNTAAFMPNYGVAYSYIYEGNYKAAEARLLAYQAEYVRTGQEKLGPSVFIWNSIARLELEFGNPEEAIKYYEKGYATVPGSPADEMTKLTWLGRLHHGKGRALAKMGKTEEAWKEAELVKKMIDDGGEPGKQFVPSYHYLAGYVKLQAGDYTQAIEHFKQTDLTDPFRELLLARAYEKTGAQADAQKLYKDITASNQITIERALAYPEAKKKLKA